jgi:hypothetical protein
VRRFAKQSLEHDSFLYSMVAKTLYQEFKTSPIPVTEHSYPLIRSFQLNQSSIPKNELITEAKQSSISKELHRCTTKL